MVKNIKSLQKTFNMHIEKLEERLTSIYTINTPKGFQGQKEPKDIFLLEEIEHLKILEGIYSVLDNEEIKYSKSSSEYLDYLTNVRNALEVLESEKKQIEESNSNEINNIKLLLKRFKEENEKL
jgi:hypothetical protein